MSDALWVQKFHSGFIDVLREHYDDCILELGLPRRIITIGDLPPSEGIFVEPYGCPIIAVAKDPLQDASEIEKLLRETLLGSSVDPGVAKSFKFPSDPPAFSFRAGIWFPILAPGRSERFDLGMFYT